jgi:hypothetical protein
LTDVTFPSDYYGEIYTGMFRNCAITAITLGNPSAIGSYALTGVYATSLNLGDRVTSIGQHAIGSHVKDVYIGQKSNILANVWNNSFHSGTTIHVPCEAYGYWHQVADFDHPDMGWIVVIDGSSGCAETQWVESGTTCIEYDKYAREIEQVRYDSYSNWFNTGNERVGRLIEADSIDCGYIPTDFKIKVELPDGAIRATKCNGNSNLNNGDPDYFGTYVKCWVGECITTMVGYQNWPFMNSPAREIYLPNTIQVIGDYCFNNANQMVSLTCYATNPPALVGRSVFDYCSSLEHIYVPAESVSAYQSATYWSDHASIISAIPNS